jgi:flagellar export protein FliJ
MTKRFRLERLGRLRRQEREQAQDALAAANAALASARSILANARAAEDAATGDEAEALRAGLMATELARSRAHLAMLRERRVRLEEGVERARTAAEDRRGELLWCRRAERQLEILGEQLREQWLAAQERSAALMADDLAMGRHGRGRAR